MKKIVYFISVLLTCTCLNRNVQAFWPDLTPLIPVSPQFCVMCIPPAIGWVYSTIDQIKDAKDRLKEMTDVTKIKQKFSSYAATIGNGALNSLSQALSQKRSGLTAARVIVDSKREGVDIRKETSIKADFVNLFLQYPTSSNKMINAYQSKGKNLKLDMALEMYITASEMYKDLCGENGKGCEVAASLGENPNIDISKELKSSGAGGSEQSNMGTLLKISLMESCFMEGTYCDKIGTSGCTPSESGGSEKTEGKEQPTESESQNGEEDKVCHWKAALDVALAYDKIMNSNEQLIQLEQQYKAVMGINTLAKIKSAEEKRVDDIKKGLDDLDSLNKSSKCQECVSKNGSMAGCAGVCL